MTLALQLVFVCTWHTPNLRMVHVPHVFHCPLQVVLEGASANITMFNLALENLAYGNEASGVLAEGTSILLPIQLWAFQYRR